MAALPITTHAARWDLEDAMRAAGIDPALLDAYEATLLRCGEPCELTAELQAAVAYRVVAP